MTQPPSNKTVGGGIKKVLYTLKTVKKMGAKNTSKALRAKNTCKACGLGMGGQRGGMTNELGEFPSVCNKSIQAQSSDTQGPIPDAIFEHSLDELRELSGHELEHLGRLNTPLYKAKNSQKLTPVSWETALSHSIAWFKKTTPAKSFFYSSGRSSNEAGFLLQLFARAYGTNNVNNCSYYCHQATSIGLTKTIGTGTATLALEDLSQSDCIFVIGANPASNHPRFIYQLKACRDRGGQVVIINPAKEAGLVKFSLPKSPQSLLMGGSDIASDYLQPKIGSDMAVMQGIAKCLIADNAIDTSFIDAHTEGFAGFKASIMAIPWHALERHTGLSYASLHKIAQSYSQAKNAVFAWGMGITHHIFGCDNVEEIVNLALLRGMLGKPGAGLLPLRGHSNVQGIGTIGVKPQISDAISNKFRHRFGLNTPTTPGLDTLSALKAADDGLIDLACIVGGNLFGASPNTHWAKKALEKISHRLHLTTTLNHGHLVANTDSEVMILPVKARDEEDQKTTQESMFNYVRLSDGGIHRHDNTRAESAILAAIAKEVIDDCHMNFSTLAEHNTLRQAIGDTIPGMAAIKNMDATHEEFYVENRHLHQPQFQTPSGKAQFSTHTLPELYTKDNTFPFVLATIRSEGQFNSIIYEESDSYRENAPRNAILMNPKDMTALNLHNHDKIQVKSAAGCMENMQALAFDIPEGNVLAYYPEANQLTTLDSDPRSQTPGFKSIAVVITKEKSTYVPTTNLA